MPDEPTRFIEGEMVFVRARVMRHGSTYEPVKGTGMERDWLLQPVDSLGKDVSESACIWADPRSVVSAAEARKIIQAKGSKR